MEDIRWEDDQTLRPKGPNHRSLENSRRKSP